MIILRLIAPLLLALLAWWGLRRIQLRYALTPSQFRWLVGTAAVLLVVLVLIVMGRLPIQALAAPFIFLLTFALRNVPLLLQLSSLLRSRSSGKSSDGTGISSIRTDWLAMELSHSTGAMDGKVLDGQFKHKLLSDMSLESLLILAGECRQDEDSLQLLEAYLDRTHPDWRAQSGQAGDDTKRNYADETMTRALALEILGLQPGASREEVTRAHRRLMQKMHPDRGGSDYLAQRINEARDFLL